MTTEPRQSTAESEGGRNDPASIVVDIDGVAKAFGKVEVLQAIHLSIHRGEIFGLVGPSGCGKSTLMGLIVGEAVPTEGHVMVEGVSPAKFGAAERQRIGFVPQGFVLYPSLTVEQNARFVGGLFGLGWLARRRRARAVLEILDLWDVHGRRAEDISGGMQRRLALACALLHEPSLLILDEPTAGLDPMLRNNVWQHLDGLRNRHVTIVVTTQNLEEADRCDRVAVMQSGRIVAVGKPRELRARALGGQAVDVASSDLQRADVEALQALHIVRSFNWLEWDRLRLIVEDAATAIPEISNLLGDRQVHVVSIDTYEPTFDDVFETLLDQGP